MLRHPYQCIASVKRSSEDSKDYLLAASGPKLLSLSLAGGEVVSEWSPQEPVGAHIEKVEAGGEQPAKKRKTAQPSETAPNVIKLAVSPDQQHAVTVTDDKCVRVFSIDSDGKLAELSQRYMPKRPCAIEILPDNATIICGDKFGDVYSLPLIPVSDKEGHDEAETEAPNPAAEAAANLAAFKPSATNLTVHTKRNRRALEAQLKQKDFTSRKEPLKFDHKLLLGHVSMLTDLTFATQEVDGKQRGYIITADRDEHIRISRAPPQSHVIEGYCLGHTEFISKVCLLPSTNLLLSGGGDDWLGVWEWPSFKLNRKIDLKGVLHDRCEVSASTGFEVTQEDRQIAISGLWAVPFTTVHGSQRPLLIVGTERRIPFLINPLHESLFPEFPSPDSPNKPSYAPLPVSDPILDVAVVGQSFVVSYDSRSTGTKRLQAYRLRQRGIEAHKGQQGQARMDLDDEELQKQLDALNREPGVETDGKKLDELLYGVSQMRKRRDYEAQEEEGAEGAEEE